MPYKDREQQREYQKRWHQSNKERRKPRMRENQINARRRNIRLIERIKSLGCMACGYKRCKGAIEFHHVDESTKSFSISSAVNQDRVGVPKLKEELRKCVRLCANCHREVHEEILQITVINNIYVVQYPRII